MSVISQETVILDNITKFYNTKEHFDIISDIINKRSKVSRRMLDWFVTNYSKQCNIVINSKFHVYQQYKNKLKGLNKRKFDPFCRGYTKLKNCQQFKFKSQHGEILTTIGQLNFFKWTIENDIITYIKDNHDILINLINAKN